ncbi:MAG TPA: S9 family peptidase [bacterium]|nr:S9 family peptidase [bacterium]
MIPTPASHLTSAPLHSVRRPGAHPLDLESLYHTKRIAAVEWSADGRHLYFETNASGRFNIWRVPADGGWPVQITVSDERTALEEPSPDGRWLLYTQDRGGDEKPNLFLMTPAGGFPRNITNTNGVGYESFGWSPDGRRLAFAAERASPGAYEVYVLDPETTEVTRIAGNERGECARLRWSPDGRRLLLTRTRNYLNHGVSVLDLDTGTERVLIPIDDSTTSRGVGWTRDGRRVIMGSNANPSDLSATGVVEIDNGAITWLTSGEWETLPVGISPAEDRFVYVRNEGGTHRVFLRLVDGPEAEIPLPAGVLSAARFSPDGMWLALLHASSSSPNEIWTYEIKTGALRRLSHSLVAGMDAEDFARPHLVVYPSFDGTPVAGFVYLPANAERSRSHPAIVYPHGGPTAQFTNGWVPQVQFLTSRGFVVMAPNFRGSTGFGRAFRQANKRDLGGGDLRDVVAAAEWLTGSGYVDPERIAVMGASYGGYLTLMALAKFPALWAAGVAIVPFANWFTEYEHEDPVLQAYDRSMMGDPVENGDLWRDRSPIFFVDRIRAPLLLLAGANDIRCPAEETQQIVEAVRVAGGAAEAKIYEHEGHGFARRENEIDAFRRVAAFLDTHMQSRRPRG